MPPKGSRKRAAVDDYEDDGGFVEDAPKSKKTKAAPVKEAKGKTEASESQYWEVCTSRAFVCKSQLMKLTARTHSPRADQRVQGQAAGRLSRVLRERRGDASGQEGRSKSSSLYRFEQ
jgi:hypothetical protein